MSFYDGIKDAIKVAQKTDNIELYQKLLDIGAQALDMQDELFHLKEENAKLKKKNDLRPLIERHNESFITLKNDDKKLCYCSHCWDVEEKMVQLHCEDNQGSFFCPHCKVEGVYDEAKI